MNLYNLPKNTIIWIQDISYIKEVLKNYFKKAVEYFNSLENTTNHSDPKLLFTNDEDFCRILTNYIIIEHIPGKALFAKNIIKTHCQPILVFNKQFELLKKDLAQKQKKGFKNIILCSSEEQEKRFHSVLKTSKT